jgi:hypothetical protein
VEGLAWLRWPQPSTEALEATRAESLNLELGGCIYPNFRLAFVELDTAGDFHLLAFDASEHGRFVHRRCRRDPAGERLVWVGGADVQKRVSGLGSEDLSDDSFNGRIFVDVRCRLVSRNDGCGLGVGCLEEERATNKEKRTKACEMDHSSAQSVHVLDDEILSFSANDGHRYAGAKGRSDIAVSKSRCTPCRVGAKEISLFCLE